MNKLLAFLGGVAVAYFVMQELEKRKQAQKSSTPSVDPKQAACEAQLAEKLKVMRISGDALNTYKKQFMVECLGGNQDVGGGETSTQSVPGQKVETQLGIPGLFNDFPSFNTAV